jgi:hypothetical protein
MLRALTTRLAIYRICREVKRIASRDPAFLWMTWFGAYYINPKHLAIWIIVKTDGDQRRLEGDPEFMSALHASLEKANYPVAARPFVGFAIGSEETCKRDYDGNWWYFFR